MLCLPGNSDSQVFVCSDCSFFFIWPYLNDSQLSDLYSKSYFTGEEDNSSTIAPATKHDYEREDVTSRIVKFNSSLELLIKTHTNARTILDVGAATGDFLNIAQSKGLSPTGLELSSYASQLAHKKYGFIFHNEKLEDFVGRHTFDLIHLNHVLEHISNPSAAVTAIQRLLSPNGLVYIEVPFQFNIIENTKYFFSRKSNKFDLFSIHHAGFYRPQTLTRLFKDHQLTCIKMRLFDWNRYPSATWRNRTKRTCWYALSLLGQGNFIEAIFRKECKR